MSRVAKKPIALVKGVEITTQDQTFTVKGPKGTLVVHRPAGVDVVIENDEIRVSSADADKTPLVGTMRAILANMVHGVSAGYERKLELVGVGYRAAMQGKDLSLSLGFSHPVVYSAPEGITLAAPTQTEIVVSGADKQRVGEVAAKIRGFRPPEPYKGKGVKYAGEFIIRKEAKKA